MVTVQRVALVSGGGHGIGAAIARRLIADGCRVIVADLDPARRADVEALGARFVAADVGDEAPVAQLLAGIAAAEGRLDALVCNAGIMVRKPLADLALDDWSRVLRTNLTSIFLLARAAEAMLRAAKGAIVTIASTRAHMSEPNTESTPPARAASSP
jgi:NAD(P)-dependent dehydrogenase (short-subunit alcohol dehydrogenase family)